MTAEPSESVKRGIAARYAAGEPLLELSLDWEVSPKRLRGWIAPYVGIRPRGNQGAPRRRSPASDPRVDRPTGVHEPRTGVRGAHRRRGWVFP